MDRDRRVPDWTDRAAGRVRCQDRNGLSMADDNTIRSYRSTDPYRARSAAPAPDQEPDNDPLLELARLIGKSDQGGRGSVRATPRPVAPEPPAPPPSDDPYRMNLNERVEPE